MTTTAQWLAAFAERVGTPVLEERDCELLLALAGSAAHASERTAAPLTTFLVGRAGLEPSRALEIARQLANELGEDVPERSA